MRAYTLIFVKKILEKKYDRVRRKQVVVLHVHTCMYLFFEKN